MRPHRSPVSHGIMGSWPTEERRHPSPPLVAARLPQGRYVELHCHSAFSLHEGTSRPEELAALASALGYRALALTDHDSLAGAMLFAQEAKEQEVQAITGAEVTLEGGAHLTLLCETPRGYANLSRLLSRANLRHPRPCAASPSAWETSPGRAASSSPSDKSIVSNASYRRLFISSKHGTGTHPSIAVWT